METSIFLTFCYNYKMGQVEQLFKAAFGDHLGMHFVDKWTGSSRTKSGTAALIDLFMQMTEDNRELFVKQVLELKSSQK